jgi:hypothetical protein
MVYRKLQNEIDEAYQAGKFSEYVSYAKCLDLGYM